MDALLELLKQWRLLMILLVVFVSGMACVGAIVFILFLKMEALLLRTAFRTNKGGICSSTQRSTSESGLSSRLWNVIGKVVTGIRHSND